MSGVHVLMRTALAIRCPPEVGDYPVHRRAGETTWNREVRGIPLGCPVLFPPRAAALVIYCECRWYRLTSKTVAAFSSGRFLPLRERRCSALFTTPYPLHRSVGKFRTVPPGRQMNASPQAPRRWLLVMMIGPRS